MSFMQLENKRIKNIAKIKKIKQQQNKLVKQLN